MTPSEGNLYLDGTSWVLRLQSSGKVYYFELGVGSSCQEHLTLLYDTVEEGGCYRKGWQEKVVAAVVDFLATSTETKTRDSLKKSKKRSIDPSGITATMQVAPTPSVTVETPNTGPKPTEQPTLNLSSKLPLGTGIEDGTVPVGKGGRRSQRPLGETFEDINHILFPVFNGVQGTEKERATRALGTTTLIKARPHLNKKTLGEYVDVSWRQWAKNRPAELHTPTVIHRVEDLDKQQELLDLAWEKHRIGQSLRRDQTEALLTGYQDLLGRQHKPYTWTEEERERFKVEAYKIFDEYVDKDYVRDRRVAGPAKKIVEGFCPNRSTQDTPRTDTLSVYRKWAWEKHGVDLNERAP